MGVYRDQVYIAREHNENRQREILDHSRENQRIKHKESDFPSGQQIAAGVYLQGNSIIVGDKY